MEVQVRKHSRNQPWDYPQLDSLQRTIAASQGPGILLLNELSPVITLGKRANRGVEVPWPNERLAEMGIQLVTTDRGGLATYHGPGQWVLFPVERLERLTGDTRGVRKAVDGLLTTALEVSLNYDLTSHIRSGCETGVWTRSGKVGSVGIHIDQGYLFHGLALNGLKTATSFLGVRPCGLDAPISYLLSDVPKQYQQAEFDRMGEQLIAAFRKHFPLTEARG